jgi:hypothetical protein
VRPAKLGKCLIAGVEWRQVVMCAPAAEVRMGTWKRTAMVAIAIAATFRQA